MNSDADFGTEKTKLSGSTPNRKKILSLQSKQEKDKVEQALNELSQKEFVIKTKEDYLITFDEPDLNDRKKVQRSSINIGQIIGSTGLVSQFMIDE